jgi:hypothetical protein
LRRIFIAMADSERSGQWSEDGAAATPPGTALVPLVTNVRRSRVTDRQSARADFVTQLIATAEHVPQTCGLRRASPVDAQVAYGAKRPAAAAPGVRTRQII